MMRRIAAALLLFGSTAFAQEREQQAMEAELDRARGEIADQVQLLAYELIDEVVYGWTQAPVFEATTPVVLAEVTVPVGLGTGLSTLVENHVGAVITENPTTNVQLVHCPKCTAVVVHSGPEGTVVSRGYDNPTVLEEMAGSGQRHALFLDLEAEGADLVLRARLTQLTPDLPIVWSRSLSTSASSPALLRSSDALQSSAEARQEYLDTLKSRGPLFVPLRFAARVYTAGFDFETGQEGVPPPPYLWVQTGVELGTTDARAWTSSLIVGASYIPQAYSGLMAQARVSRLLTGRSRSLTRPDLYAFFGGAVITTWGAAAASFQEQAVDADALAGLILGQGPRYTLGALHLGLDLRVGQRIGISAFAETLPGRTNSPNIGAFTFLLGVPVHTIGTEVTFWF